MDISLIVAASKNRVIGKDNQLLWRLPADMKRFRKLTMGKPIIMGRKTFASIGKPLPGRDNIIITRNKSFEMPGLFVVHSVEEALILGRTRAQTLGVTEIMVIGGEQIYKESLPFANRIYYSLVECELGGDAFFPELDEALWDEGPSEFCERDELNEFDHSFKIYQKIK